MRREVNRDPAESKLRDPRRVGGDEPELPTSAAAVIFTLVYSKVQRVAVFVKVFSIRPKTRRGRTR